MTASGRFVIALGSPECRGYDTPFLPRVEEDVSRMLEFFSQAPQDYQIAPAGSGLVSLKSGEFRERICGWFANEARREEDVVAVYIAGHGDYDGGFGHRLLTIDSTPRNPAGTAIASGDLARWFFEGEGERPGNILLFLDVCFAGKGAAEAVAELARALACIRRTHGTGLWIVATTTPTSEAGDGHFVEAFLDIMKNDAWAPRGGAEYLSPSDVVDAVNEWFDTHRKQQRAVCNLLGATRSPRFIRNPNFCPDLDGLSVAERAHWDSKARGVDTVDAPGWFFTGRKQALDELVRWLDAPISDGRARVVTGAPGSGKSAVLGWLALASHKTTRAAMMNAGQTGLPPVGAVAVRLHAKGARAADLVRSLCEALGEAAPDVESIVNALAARPGPIGIIVDSLDEASEPALITRNLLLPLATSKSVRLIVGSRRNEAGGRQLFGDAVVVDLDRPPYFASGEIAQYVAARLVAAVKASEPSDISASAARIGAQVEEKAGKSFLYGRLACRQLEASGDTAAWERLLELPTELQDVFGADLDRFEPEKRLQLIDLLVPLAYAKGKGLPQKKIWHTIASEISGRTCTNAMINEMKENAGYYLVQDTEAGETVYRLFHKTFADYLIERTRDDGVEEGFARALRKLCPSDPVQAWISVSPYILHNLPRHVAAGTLLDEFLADPAFLLNTPPEVLLPELSSADLSASSRAIVKVYRQAVHWIRQGGREALAHLIWAAQQHDAKKLVERLPKLPADGAWSPEWTVGTGRKGAQVIVVAQEKLVVATACRDDGPNPLVAAMDEQGSVHLWDAVTAQPRWSFNQDVGYFLNYGAPPRLFYAFCAPDHVLVVSWGMGRPATFDLTSGKLIAWGPLSEKGISTACVIPIEAANPLLAVAFKDDSLAVFQLPDFSVVAQMPSAVNASIYGMAPFNYEGTPAFISCGDTYANGQFVESVPKRIWSALTLEVLWSESDGGRAFRAPHHFVANGCPYLAYSAYGSEFTVHDCRTGEKAILPGLEVALDTVFGHVQSDGRIRIIGRVDGKQVGIAVGMAPLSLTAMQTGNDAGDAEGPIFQLFGVPYVLGVVGKQVRAYDVSDSTAPSDDPVSVRADAYGPIFGAAGGEGYVVAFSAYSLRCWTAAGQQVWTQQSRCPRINRLAIDKGNCRSVVVSGSTGGYVEVFDLANGAPITTFKAGACVEDLKLLQSPAGLLAFIGVRTQGNQSHYAVRVWNLDSNTEVPTKGSPPSEWRMVMDGYYETKPLRAVAALHDGASTLCALAGPHGEVKIMDLATLAKVDVFVGGEMGVYVTQLMMTAGAGGPLLFGGDERGSLFRRMPRSRESHCSCREHAHTGAVTGLCVVPSAAGDRIVSGGSDGRICIWTTGLELVFAIEADHPIVGLSTLGSGKIVFATDRAVGVLRIS